MSKQCVYCESSENLNTSLSVTLEDGTKVTVDICDEHAEEATIKSAREAYEAKQEKIKEVMEMAKKLGLSVSDTPGGVAVVQPSALTPQQKPPVTESKKAPDALDPNSPDVISTSRIDGAPGMVSVGGATDLGPVESHQSLQSSDLQDKLPDDVRDGAVQMGVVEGREGQPLAIQRKRVDGTGTTRVAIIKSEDDRKLQDRFKRMADDSMQDRTPDFARQGYAKTMTNCPVCRGDCEVNGDTCPKCKGAGQISVY